ncbi:MAG: hypothetical protein AVDCRST_MAG68-2886 [uncultured Gemmatimonadetes bacterium]|uniref:Uncharacterized protein n=1 Tax=uncultured Gemmatimonadota bacterium TaxID=203437 RepID=A0A6J4LRU4_9BACT|nr:MAG: hypothetical protein AVDCRST_MAG68-2886 [uncultured Gemmatimonadota bacterium]
MSTDEITRDPELAALLRAAAPEPPVDEVDWERLRGAVRARAELPLARLRRDAAPRRTRRWLPLSAAAAIAAVALGVSLRPAPEPLPVEERRLVEAIVAESLPANVDQMISGDAAEGALLEAAVGS